MVYEETHYILYLFYYVQVKSCEEGRVWTIDRGRRKRRKEQMDGGEDRKEGG